MDIANRTVLILGGSGLVGHAVARRLLAFGPKAIVLVGLFEDEVVETARQLEPIRGEAEIITDWGNVFMPVGAAHTSQRDAMQDDALRQEMVSDLLGAFTKDVVERTFLYQLFKRHRPDAVVDCINTATAFAYQDVVESARGLLRATRAGALTAAQVESHVLRLTMPQLVRHIQIVSAAVRDFATRAYVKIGTSGTGGMGLNVPYTHSEEWPSRTLLTKSAVAGAHSLLLFLLGRTPGAPAIVEIKPTATIAWREIGFGPVRRKGKPIPRYDCPEPLAVDAAFADGAGGWVETGGPVESVYIDTGENGVFARDEFETVSSLGSMEFITPEEVADYVLLEITGRPSGRDIIAALDAATAGPTYKAGILRAFASERLRRLESEHGVRSVAFEMLGPPRLTKHLYEAYIFSQLVDSIRGLAEADAATLAADAAGLVAEDAQLRSLIVSVGLPILIDGEKVYRAETVIVLPGDREIEATVPRGWVDLRTGNCATWIDRARRICDQDATRRDNSGSGSDEEWWAMRADGAVEPARCAAWIFEHEDGGTRIKR